MVTRNAANLPTPTGNALLLAESNGVSLTALRKSDSPFTGAASAIVSLFKITIAFNQSCGRKYNFPGKDVNVNRDRSVETPIRGNS